MYPWPKKIFSMRLNYSFSLITSVIVSRPAWLRTNKRSDGSSRLYHHFMPGQFGHVRLAAIHAGA